MVSRRRPMFTALAAAAFAALAAQASADAVVTRTGNRIEGKIVSNDGKTVVLETERYGQMTFRRVDLQKIEFSGAALLPPPAAGGSAPPPPQAPPAGGEAPNPFAPPGAQASVPAMPPPMPTAAPTAVPTQVVLAAPPAADDPRATFPKDGRGGVLGFFAGMRETATVAQWAMKGDASAAPAAAAPPAFPPAAAAPPAGGSPFDAAPPAPASPFGDAGAPPVPDFFANAGAQQAPPSLPPPPAAGSGLPSLPPPPGQAAGSSLPTLAAPGAVAEATAAAVEVAKVPEPPQIKAGFDGAVFDIVPATQPVEVFEGTATQPSPEDASRMLRRGDRVRTKAGRAQLSIRQKADILRLPPETDIRLEEISADSEKVVVRVNAGSLWTDVATRTNPEDFKVVTPDLTAGVRGTRFKVQVLYGQGTLISVDEGEVSVSSLKAPVATVVRPAQAVFVNASGQLSEVLNRDPMQAQREWDEWARQAADDLGGTGLMAGAAVQPLLDQIAQDNARWEVTVGQANQLIASNKYRDKLKEIGDAFMRFSADTGYVPEAAEAWMLLRENTRGLAGWNGPYIEGAIPPIDPFGQVLVYEKRRSDQSGNTFGILYSLWSDRRDSKGQAPGDMAELIKFFEVPAIRDNPAYAPPQR